MSVSSPAAILLAISLSTTAHGLTFNVNSAGPPDALYSYWNLTYNLTNTTAQTVKEINIYVDALLFPALYPEAKPGWDTVNGSVGPFAGVNGLPYDYYGFYNAQAAGSGVLPGGTETFTFMVAYQGLPGSEVPQSQFYELFYDDNGNRTLLDSGYAQLNPPGAVPEPSTCTLLAVGLGGFALIRRRALNSRQPSAQG